MMYQAPQPRTSVLIVEDEVLVRFHVADVLAEHEFDVLEAGSAAQALELLDSGSRIDVLFTDVNMPGAYDGIELARIVRARWPHTAILITSGRHWPHIDHTLGGFVPKPYLPEQVAQTIGRMVGRRAETACAAE